MLYFSVPAPTVNITNDPPAIVSNGRPVTMTCTVELSPSVDVPVTVNTVWTGPAGLMIYIASTTQPVAGSTTFYTNAHAIVVTCTSFGKDQSGDYTCTANIVCVHINA